MSEGRQEQSDPDITAEIDKLNQQAWELRYADYERAEALSERAKVLSTQDTFAEHPYEIGVAASLTTLAYLNHQQGKLDAALAQCLDALRLMAAFPSSRVAADAARIVGWIYYFLGDYSNALAYGIKALRITQELELPVLEASVLDGLAMTYAATGDIQQALRYHSEALFIARNSEVPALECAVLNNMAGNLYEAGDAQAALECSRKSLDIARQLSNFKQIVSSSDTQGQILTKMGEIAKAEDILLQALGIASDHGMELGQIYCFLNLGKLYLGEQELEKAASHIQAALHIAESIGAKPLHADCHRILSEVFEQLGDLRQALEQYRLFYKLREEINSEVTTQQISALKVAHEVETARRDAEIFRLRNFELQHEIEERKNIEAELKRLAAIDVLTDIYNRRHFFDLVRLEHERALRQHLPLTILMIDIDCFKSINDVYGHAVGDQVLVLLTSFIRCKLRQADIIGRYGGDELVIALPDTRQSQGLQLAERMRHHVAKHPFKTTAGVIKITISAGVACLAQSELATNTKLDQLVDQADQAALLAKREGRNTVRLFAA